jgi:hypothetical protein
MGCGGLEERSGRRKLDQSRSWKLYWSPGNMGLDSLVTQAFLEKHASLDVGNESGAVDDNQNEGRLVNSFFVVIPIVCCRVPQGVY